MHITILTPDEEIYQGEINSVSVPGKKGRFQVLKNHAPLVSSLESGKVSIKTDAGEMMNFLIEKGFIEVLNNQISLLVQGYQAS